MAWFEKDSYKEGRKAATKGEPRDPFKVLDEDYQKGYEDGEGLKDGSQYEKEKREEGIMEGLIGGMIEGGAPGWIDKLGRSERYQDSFDRGRETYGKDERDMPEPRSSEQSSSSKDPASDSSRSSSSHTYSDSRSGYDEEYEAPKTTRRRARPVQPEQEEVSQEDDSPWVLIGILGLTALFAFLEANKQITTIKIDLDINKEDFAKMLNGQLYRERVTLGFTPLAEEIKDVDLPDFEAEVKMWRKGQGEYTDEPLGQSMYWEIGLSAPDLINIIREGLCYEQFFSYMDIDSYTENFESVVKIWAKN